MTTNVAIIGRPNVGKSTLFNRLAGKRLALVDDRPGVTRDRREGDARLAGLRFRIIDTAGLDEADAVSLEGRMRFPLEVFRAVRGEWPQSKPMSVRISASDWMEDGSGTTPEESVAVAKRLKAEGLDLVDVSSAGNVPDSACCMLRRIRSVSWAACCATASGRAS